MKKTLKMLCGILCLLSVLLITLSGCDLQNMFGGSVDVPTGDGVTPIYYGMLLFNSADVEIPEVNYIDGSSDKKNNGNTDNNGNHYGWYKDNDGVIKPIHDEQKPLYVSQNQDVYAYVGISNPGELQIVSFVINGQIFTSDMFDARSTNEVKIVKFNVGEVQGMIDYTISEIKYADGEETKNVIMLGNATAKVAVKGENPVTATVNQIELRDSGKEVFFDIAITDELGLIALSNGNVKVIVYRDGKDKKEAELTVGENKVTIKTLNKNKEHEYEIVAYYDDLSGEGPAYHTLVSRRPLQTSHAHIWGDWEITKKASCTDDGEETRTCVACGEEETHSILATGHKWSNACDTMCNVTGCDYTRATEHTYDNACDADCNICGETRVVLGHVFDNDCDTDCNICGEIRVTEHVYDNACDPICNACGYTRVTEHTYDNACDADCNVCGETRVVPGHVYDNDCDTDCNVCGVIRVTYHVYDDQYDATCNVCGFVREVECAHRNTITLPGKVADCINTGLTEGKKCADCGETLVEQTIIPATGVHNYENNVCVICKGERFSEGLEYTSNGNGTCYVSGIGTCTDTDIIIPKVSPKGWIVTGIGDNVFWNNQSITSIKIPNSIVEIGVNAFANCSSLVDVHISDLEAWCKIDFESNPLDWGRNLWLNNEIVTTLVIPTSITEIKPYAFAGCSSIQTVVFHDSITKIGRNAFFLCSNIKRLTIPNSVTDIEDWAFYWCGGLETVTIGTGVKNIGWEAFYECRSLKGIEFLDGATIIGDRMFGGCSALTQVIIPNSMAFIVANAFHGCSSLKNIYYKGTMEEWGEIVIDDTNLYSDDNILDFPIYYYSETQPTTEGNFWHYVDGVPTVWEKYEPEVFIFTLLDDGTYEVSVMNVTLLPDDIVIPKEYKGIPVTRIAANTFNADKGRNWFNSITIPNTIKSIGENAFNCCVFKEVYVYDLANWLSMKFDNSGSYPHRQITYNSTLHILDSEGKELVEAIIPEEITTIGCVAFSVCHSLETIVLHNGVVKIDAYAFDWCENLKNIVIGNGVTYISDSAFIGRNNLTSVFYYGTAAEWNNITVGNSYGNSWFPNATIYFYSETKPTTEGNFWHYVNGVPTVWEAHSHSYTSVGTASADYATVLVTYTCSGCGHTYSETVVPTDFTVTADNRAMIGFTGEANENLVIPAVFEDNGTWYRVVAIGDYAFYECNIENVEFPSTVTYIGMYAFAKTVLKNIIIPDSVTDLGVYAYLDCVYAETIIIGNGITTIGACTFSGCSSLLSVTIGENVNSIHFEAFRPSKPVEVINKSSLNIVVGTWDHGEVAWGAIEVHSGETKIQKLGDYVFYVLNDEVFLVKYLGNAANIVLPDTYNGKPYSIYKNTFENHENIISVIISDNVTGIGNGAFRGCTNLESISIPDSVTSIGGNAFALCYSLKFVHIGNGVEYIGTSAFDCCHILQEIVIGKGPMTIIHHAFYECDVLNKIYFRGEKEEFKFITVEDNNYKFMDATRYYYSETQPTTEGNFWHYVNGVPTVWGAHVESSDSIGLEFTLNSDGMSYSVKGIGTCTDTNIIIPNEYKGLPVTAIYHDAFVWCESIVSVKIPDSVTIIDDYAFEDCRNIKSITMGNSVVTIGAWAFADCEGITNVVIPNSVTKIENAVFAGCGNLTRITFEGTVGQWNNIQKGDYWHDSVPATEVICSDGVVSLN